MYFAFCEKCVERIEYQYAVAAPEFYTSALKKDGVYIQRGWTDPRGLHALQWIVDQVNESEEEMGPLESRV